MKISKILSSLLFSLITSMLFGQAISLASAQVGIPVNPFAASAAVMVGKAVLTLSDLPVMVSVGINKEIWLSEIAENFYPAGTWMTRSRDFSPFVENDRINWAAIGTSPTVYVNRDTVANPVPIVPRSDSHRFVDLDVFDSENTPVTNVEQYELAYDKRQTILTDHKGQIWKTLQQYAAHAWAPASNSTTGPVIGTTGATADGHKRFSALDIAALKKRFDDLDFPEIGRVLLLNTDHLLDLQVQDLELYKALINLRTGQALPFAGFDIYTNGSIMPVYNKSTLAKKAIGAAAAPSTDSPSTSVAWVESQVFRADGSWDLFLKERDPELRADFMGFQKRFKAATINNNRATGAIVKVAA